MKLWTTGLLMEKFSLRNAHRNSKHLQSKLLLCTLLLYNRGFINATAFTLHLLVHWGAWPKCLMWLIYSSLYCKKWLDKETLTPWEVMGQSAASHTQTINYSYMVAESSANTVQTGTVSCQYCHIHIFVFSPQFSSPWFILNRCPIKYSKSNTVQQPSAVNTGKQRFTPRRTSLLSRSSTEWDLLMLNRLFCRFQAHFFQESEDCNASAAKKCTDQEPLEQVCLSQVTRLVKSKPKKKSSPDSSLFSLM